MTKLMNWLGGHLWPFSRINRLHRACSEHFEFGQACIAYLNQIHQPWQHVRLNGKLYIMGLESCEVMQRGDANVIWYRTAEGMQEFVARKYRSGIEKEFDA